MCDWSNKITCPKKKYKRKFSPIFEFLCCIISYWWWYVNDEGPYDASILAWVPHEGSSNGVTKAKVDEESLTRNDGLSWVNPYPMLDMEDMIFSLVLLQPWSWPFCYLWYSGTIRTYVHVLKYRGSVLNEIKWWRNVCR